MGIGGISMSCFAMLLHSEGFTVSGSDSRRSDITEKLEREGITVIYGQKAENITSDIDLVVYTAAIHPDNPEYAAAAAAGIPMMRRADMVGQVMRHYRNAIAVSGTHGKTTTTSLMTHVLLAANLDPTVSVGGILKAIDGNLRIGHSDYFLTEACEYTNSFLSFAPRMSIILNVDADHLDFFKNIENIRRSFREFAEMVPADGVLIINGQIPDVHYFTDGLPCPVITYGLAEETDSTTGSPIVGRYDYEAAAFAYDKLGRASYDLYIHGQKECRVSLNIVGRHNISNSLPVIALSQFLGISNEHILEGIRSFTGTDRRFEYKGEFGGVTVIDDYAHHPTEIRATLTAAKNCGFKRIWTVFQPHTYSRTKALLHEFADALTLSDKVVVADIYAAREKDPGDISSRDLADAINALGGSAIFLPTFEAIENFLLENCTQNDLLITMGAGDVVEVGENLLGR